jgi:hypothetical protein
MVSMPWHGVLLVWRYVVVLVSWFSELPDACVPICMERMPGQWPRV